MRMSRRSSFFKLFTATSAVTWHFLGIFRLYNQFTHYRPVNTNTCMPHGASFDARHAVKLICDWKIFKELNESLDVFCNTCCGAALSRCISGLRGSGN